MIEEYMRLPASSTAIFGVLFLTAALIGTPLAIFALQQQQEIRQRADTTVAWTTNQSASSACDASGATIKVTFTNTEPNRTSTAMTVTVQDRQTGKIINLGSVSGGQTKSDFIKTGKSTIAAGTVDFSLKWTDGHSGTDSRSASYQSVSYCAIPSPTPTPKYPSVTPPYSTPPYTTPSKPYSTPYPSTYPSPYPSTYYPSPTICPTLGPVKNVRIDCPNCPK